jgi:GT2 family glycosyltransferase
MNHSIIVPVHNEAENLRNYVVRFIRELEEKVPGEVREIILVENGSKDGTIEECLFLVKEFPESIRYFSIDRPSYGEAIKQGMLQANGDTLSILECDFLDADFVKGSLEVLESKKSRFVIASKRHPDSIDKRPLKRRILTALFNKIFLNFFLSYPGTDTHGLKSIETALAKELCRLSLTTDEVFQTEMVLIAWRKGNCIYELPIKIREKRTAPISIMRRLPKVIRIVKDLRKSLRRF